MVPHKDQHHRTVHLGEVVGEQPQGGIRVVQPHDQRVQNGQVLLGQLVALGGKARGLAVLFRGVSLVVLHGHAVQKDRLAGVSGFIPGDEFPGEGVVGGVLACDFHGGEEVVQKGHRVKADGRIDGLPVVQLTGVGVEGGGGVSRFLQQPDGGGQVLIDRRVKGIQGIPLLEQRGGQAGEHLHLHMSGPAAIGVGEKGAVGAGLRQTVEIGQGVLGGGAGLHLETLGPGGVEAQHHPHPFVAGFLVRAVLVQAKGGGLKGARVQRREEQSQAQTAQDEALGEGGTPGLLAAEGFRENGRHADGQQGSQGGNELRGGIPGDVAQVAHEGKIT